MLGTGLPLFHLEVWGSPFGLPDPLGFPSWSAIAAYYGMAPLSGALAALFRERFMAVFSRAFFVFAVIALAEVARMLPRP